MSNVKSLFGGPSGEREVVQSAVDEAKALLEAVQSGEVCGFAIVRLHHDQMASWRVAGHIGGYSMIGGLEHAKAVIMEINGQ